MDAARGEKRRSARKAGSGAGSRIARIGFKDGLGQIKWLTADILDSSSSGAGLSLARPLDVGKTIELRGHGAQNGVHARVVWCSEQKDGSYSAGIDFLEAGAGRQDATPEDRSASPDAESDYYEVMQLSPNADTETIHRVYRILAQRYHPDNATSGSDSMFLRLSEAFSTLSDPTLRAAYDARHGQMRRVRRKIFADMEAPGGSAGEERRKRQAVLDLLYAKMLNDFEHPALTVREMEDMLGCPKEHLQATLWFLKGKGYIQRSDNGRYELTVEGFERAEGDSIPPGEAERRGNLLTAGRHPGMS